MNKTKGCLIANFATVPVFEDMASGKNARRPGLKRALRRLRPGDVLVVWKLDRLGRSVRDLITLVSEL
ncbi:TPA: recombinase family protein, partial [Klebsiella pneumoniae]